MTSPINNLETTIAGVKFDNPLLNAAGCWDTTKKQLDQLMVSNAGGVVTKSCTFLPRDGHPNPRLFIDNLDSSINSIGLANQGAKYYAQYNHRSTKPFIQSIHAQTSLDLGAIVSSIATFSVREPMIELDIGCPNVPKDKQTLDWESYEQLLGVMSSEADLQNNRERLIWGVKLPPLFYPQDISTMASLVRKSNASFITTVNTIPNGLFVNIWLGTTRICPNDGRGGIGGALIKPIGLANVQQYYREFSTGRPIDIIGCGGISYATDVMEYIMCGAKAVQIGTHLLQYGPPMFKAMETQLSRLVTQLTGIFPEKKLLLDFVGTMRIRKAAL